MGRTDPFEAEASPGYASGTTLVCRGELDIATVPIFEAAVIASAGDVLVDCRALTFLDAGALGAIVAARAQLAQNDRSLHLTLVPPRIQRVLEITGLEELLEPGMWETLA
jgi:anti-anti-sigma factor